MTLQDFQVFLKSYLTGKGFDSQLHNEQEVMKQKGIICQSNLQLK